MAEMPDSSAMQNPATEAAPDLRPPALSNRGHVLTFDIGQVFKDYYGPMRFLGYSSSVFLDLYVDRKEAKAKELGQEFDKQKTKNVFSKIEAGYFGALTGLYALRDWRDMLRNFKGAVAAEQGKSPSEVGGAHMRKSNNPIIQTALRRFSWMLGVRWVADATFLAGINIGLLGQAGRVTIERTLFNQKTSYDKLEQMFENVQGYGFDIQSKEKIARELALIVQECQKDHQREPWSREVLIHYAPFFNSVGDAIVKKQVGMQEVTYILGELMTRRLTLEDSQELFARIKDDGLDSLRQKPFMVSTKHEKSVAENVLATRPKMTAGQFTQLYRPLSQEAIQSLAKQGLNTFSDRVAQPQENVEIVR